MQKNIEKFKEFWEDRKKRAIMILTGYAIFFIIVLLVFLPRTQMPEPLPTTIEEEEIVEKEGRQWFIGDYQKRLLIETEAEVLDKEILFIDDVPQLTEEQELEIVYDALYFDIEKIKEIIDVSILVARNTNFIENYDEELYFLSGKQVSEIMPDGDFELELNLKIRNDKIIEVEFSFFDDYNDITNLKIIYSEIVAE